MIYRKVNFDRNNQNINNFNVFLDEALGKAYSLTVPKLLRKQTVKVTDANREIVAEDRTFFCSELVAKTFKVI